MINRPKFSVFRAWVRRAPEQASNGDKLCLPSQPNWRERQTEVKVAQFLVLVALLFVLADHLGRIQERTDANIGPDSTSLVNLVLYPPERPESTSGFIARFRLSNKGNRPIFYPAGNTTSVPVGQLVARASSTSDWMSLSSTPEQRVPAVEEVKDSNLRWIELPPGGWVDGEFRDVGESSGQHAYVIYVKVARDGNGIRIVSKPYSSPAKQ
jgi:hypothetical protein